MIGLSCLKPHEQKEYVTKNEIQQSMIPALAPDAALEAAIKAQGTEGIVYSVKAQDSWTDETALSLNDLKNKKLTRWVRIIQEAMNVPRGWKKSKWIEAVGIKNKTCSQQIYKKIKKYEKSGLAGIKHTKPNQKGRAKSWTPEAVDFWLGLCLKEEHRKISKDHLYNIMVIEADKRSWQVGGYNSALWWFKKKATPQLLALQRGGLRALDNTLPPVLRDYSDLQPFEILVGDQHRFDFWVTDDDTGEVFRPEGYFWQDLRTRCFYGAGFDRKYDSYLMGLALRMGMKIFGPFDSIYTDHGKPEESKYVMGIMQEMRDLGLHIERTVDIPVDLSGTEPEDVNPSLILPGTHRKAIVRNAKAKMIEGTFSALEAILRSHFMVPGSVKILGGSQEENEVDQEDIERLAAAGKLLTFREFVLTVFKALDYYNSQKPHRGVLREWIQSPRPKSASPMDCLKTCYAEGWRPVRLTEEAVDLIFLPKEKRIVDRGRITLRGELYENEKLDALDSQKVQVRFDPLDPGWLLVFHNGEYLCRAVPVEYSSMKDQSLAKRKIEEKRRRRKDFVQEYRAMTSYVPDFRQYSTVPAAEKAAALIGKEKIEKRKEIAERTRVRTPEELAAEIAVIENYHPEDIRPVFHSEVARYTWCLDQEIDGKGLDEKDKIFARGFEGGMNEETREYWRVYRESVEMGQRNENEPRIYTNLHE